MNTAKAQTLPFELIAAELEQVRLLIQRQFDGVDEHLAQSLKIASGKMLRPALVLLAGRCFSPLNELHISAAAAIELIHISTLLHDDVLDEAQLRRCKPSINCLYGNKLAILAGDLVFAKAFQICSIFNNPQIALLLAQTTSTICTGEIRQSFARNNWHLSRDEYVRIIIEKSATFFSASAQAGAFASKAVREHVEILGCFGINLGIAFQIMDDINDIAASPVATGKPLGGDLVNGVPTLPAILFVENATAEQRPSLLATLTNQEMPVEEKIALIQSSPALAQARQIAVQYQQKALNQLGMLPACPTRDSLRNLVSSIVSPA